MNRYLFLLSLIVLALFSCKKGEDKADAGSISIEVSSISGKKANLLVKHDGGNTATYYVLCKKMEGGLLPDEDLIDLARKELSGGGKALYGRNRVITVDGIEEGAVYSAMVVFTGDNADIIPGMPYGRVDFSTGADGSLNITLLSKDKTSFRIKVESTSDSEWCIFASSDIETDDQIQIGQFLSDEDIKPVRLSGSQTVVFQDLEPGWKYKVIATETVPLGGRLYSCVSDQYRTDFDLVFSEKWNVKYKGLYSEKEAELPGPQFEMDLPAYSTIIGYLWPDYMFDSYDIKYLVEWSADNADSWVGNSKYGWKSHPVMFAPVTPGIRRLLIVETNGETSNLTGRYYLSDPITIQYDGPAKSYLRWLGKWIVGDDRVSYTVTIEEKEENKSFSVSGWQGLEDVFTADYVPRDGTLSFQSHVIYEDYTYNNGRHGYITFGAQAYNPKTGKNSVTQPGLHLAYAYFIDAESAVIEPEIAHFINGEETRFLAMQFIRYFDDDSEYCYPLEDIDKVPHFPMTMTRITDATSETKSGSAICGSISLDDYSITQGVRAK